MDRKQFSVRFKDAIELMVTNTKMICFNDIVPEYKFIVTANEIKSQVVLDDIEIAYVKKLKEDVKNPLSFDEVLDLVQVGDRHPLWINISVYEAAPDVTFIETVCSKRLRNVESTPNIVDKFPPFHVWVPAPTKELRVKVNSKFDVNWRAGADKNQKKGLFNKLRSLFSGD
jgi:hypothetical protein